MNFRVFVAIVIMIGGLIMLFISSYLLEYESNIPTYIFGVSAFFNDKPNDFKLNYPLNYFLLYYDFTKNEGNISFLINFENSSLDKLKIIISNLKNETVGMEIYDCDRGYLGSRNCTEEASYLYEYVNRISNLYSDDFGNPDRTTLIFSNFTEPLRNNRINVRFQSELKPSAIFDLLHENNIINYNSYAIEFKLGNEYQCFGRCVIDLVRWWGKNPAG